MEKRRVPYDEWLLSGRQIFLAEGVDYSELTEIMRAKLRDAGERRGLKVATKVVHDPPGIVFRAYLPTHVRPVLGDPTQPVTKKWYPHLFCRESGCAQKLRPLDDEKCRAHA